MQRLLFVKSRRASFIELDEQLLAERFEVREIYQPGRFSNPLTVLREVLRADLIVGWWASWHTFLPFTLAWLLRKPSLLIVGGFDTAREPEFGYGYQLGGSRALLSRWTMRRARGLMTNSLYSQAEVQRNIGIPAERVAVVYHGIPDGAGTNADSAAPAPAAPVPKRRLALTVGVVDTTNLERKGLRPFVESAALVPDVEFVLAGKLVGDAGEELRRIAPANVRIAGWVSDAELQELFAAAAVYVQASRHEGFGVSVAEAMLARCVPVVTRAGALTEVVGETGVILDSAEPEAVADGIRRALTLETGDAARQRVLTEFSVQRRRDGLLELLEGLSPN